MANLVAAMGYGEYYQATALLHDRPEDNKDLSRVFMYEWGIPSVVVSASFTLDKTQYSCIEDYRFEVGINPLATVAKVGDSLFNLSDILNGNHFFDPEKAFIKADEYCDNLIYLLPKLPQRDLILG